MRVAGGKKWRRGVVSKVGWMGGKEKRSLAVRAKRK